MLALKSHFFHTSTNNFASLLVMEESPVIERIYSYYNEKQTN